MYMYDRPNLLTYWPAGRLLACNAAMLRPVDCLLHVDRLLTIATRPISSMNCISVKRIDRVDN